MSEYLDYFNSPFVWRAALAIIFIAVNAGLAGAFAAFRGATFLVSGAAHAALAGAALVIVLQAGGILVGVNPVIGGALAAVALALLAGYVGNRSADRETDTAIGVGFAFSMALAVLLISFIPESASRVWGILMGDLMLLTSGDLILLGGFTLIIAMLFVLFWRPFVFVTFDMEGARAFGIKVPVHNYLLFAVIGLSTAVLLKGVGAIVVFAMLVAPAATALLFARSVQGAMLYAFLIALFSGFVALALSYHVQFSVGALAAALSAFSYFIGRTWLACRR